MLSDSYIDTITALVKEANETFVLPRFRNPESQGLDNKTHAYDLVTKADKEAEAFLIDTLSNAFPQVYVVGEETISANPDSLAEIFAADVTLLLDPVDGTLNFTQGSPIFGTIVSVLKKGVPVAGIIYDPIVDDWVIAEQGSGAFYSRQAVKKPLLNEPVRVPVFINNISGSTRLKASVEEAMEGHYGILRNFWSSAHDYRFMAMGSATGFISQYCKPWDHAAGSVILTESGGKVAFLDGTAYITSRDVGPLLAVQAAESFDDIQARLLPNLS